MKLLGSIVAVANCQLPARSQAQQASVSVAAPPVAAPRTTDCRDGWTRVSYGGVDTCFQDQGKKEVGTATAVCNSVNGKVPLPTNEAQQGDLNAVFDALGLPSSRFVALDADTFNSQTNPWNKWYTSGSGFVAQPDNGSAAGPCLISDSRLNKGEWNNVKCDFNYNIVCQAEPDVPVLAAQVTSCNDGDGLVQLSATVYNHAGVYSELDVDGNGVFPANQLAKSFVTDGGVNYLVLTKVLGSTDCTQVEVDGVDVCVKVAEQITLQCKYSLADQDVTDDFQVTGQDTQATAENTGTLGYTLTVEDGNIGDQIKFTVSPLNSGLVYATVKSCDVVKGGNQLTIVGHGSQSCTNPVVNTQAITSLFSSQNDIEGSWKAFKWSTASAQNVEDQSLSCTIGLSENVSDVTVEDCSLSNAPPELIKYNERMSIMDWTGMKLVKDGTEYFYVMNSLGPDLRISQSGSTVWVGQAEASRTIEGDTLVIEYNQSSPSVCGPGGSYESQVRVSCDAAAGFSVVNVEQVTDCRFVWQVTADCSKCYPWQTCNL